MTKPCSRQAQPRAARPNAGKGWPCPNWIAFRWPRYPHEPIGLGKEQRLVIAMAIALRPRSADMADEPTTPLDVTTQAADLDLLKSLARDDGMGLLMITMDLAVVADIGRTDRRDAVQGRDSSNRGCHGRPCAWQTPCATPSYIADAFCRPSNPQLLIAAAAPAPQTPC